MLDNLGRSTTVEQKRADYGTNDNSGAPTRPTSAPASSDTVLVSQTDYYPAGEVKDQTGPKSQVSRSEYDNLGRITKITQNHGSTPTEVTETAYAAGGQVKTLTAKNATTGDQITTYAYGTVLAGTGLANSKIASNALLASVTYPDSALDKVSYEYNRQGQSIQMTDQNGSVHDYEYDSLGRRVEDKVAPGTGVDGAVKRLLGRTTTVCASKVSLAMTVQHRHRRS